MKKIFYCFILGIISAYVIGAMLFYIMRVRGGEVIAKSNIPTVIISNEVPYIPLGDFTITHYTHTGNNCKNGYYPTLKTVAVDEKAIPLGSLLYIEGYGVRVAMDTGSAIKGNKIDIFVDTEKEAVEMGIKTAKVYIIGD